MSFDFSSVLAVTLAAVGNGADRDTAARAAYPVIYKAGVTLPELLREERAGEKVKLGVSAAYRTLVAGMRSLLEHGGTDIADAQAVRHAIRDEVWADEGHAVRLEHRKAKPATETAAAVVALTPAELKVYQNVSARISRLARDIVDAPKVVMPEKAKARVSSDTMALVVGKRDAGKTKAQVKAELLAALDRAFA